MQQDVRLSETGVVERAVKPSELAYRCRHERFDLGFVGNIVDTKMASPSRCRIADTVSRPCATWMSATTTRAPAGGARNGRRASDTRATARDDDRLPFKRPVHALALPLCNQCANSGATSM